MKFIFLVFLLIMSGCSTQSLKEQIADTTFGAITGSDYSRNPASCPRIRMQCAGGNYEEWIQDNGQLACACNN